MSKPKQIVQVTTLDEKVGQAEAVFDSGSMFTILRQDKVPDGAKVIWMSKPKEFNTAAVGGKLQTTGAIELVITIGDKMVEDSALVSPALAQEMIIGAGTMQKWDITIQNRNGQTSIVVGRDMRDPDMIEID